MGDRVTLTVSDRSLSNFLSTARAVSQSPHLDSPLSGSPSPLARSSSNEALMPQSARRELRIEASLPAWREIIGDFQRLKDKDKTAKLWWAGVPPSIRSKLWKLAIPNDLNITPELFDIHVAQAAQAKRMAQGPSGAMDDDDPLMSKMEALKRVVIDLHESFAAMKLFQEGGPYHGAMLQVLEAHVVYRPDIGFVRGMSQMVAMLLLNLDPPDAFIAFANMLNAPLQRAFFGSNIQEADTYFLAFEQLTSEFLPKVHKHFNALGVVPHLFLTDWILSMYSKTLPLEVASHVWDVYLLEGELFVFRVALGILHMSQSALLALDFEHCVSHLLNPPEVSDDTLFSSIQAIALTEKKFAAAKQKVATMQQKK